MSSFTRDAGAAAGGFTITAGGCTFTLTGGCDVLLVVLGIALEAGVVVCPVDAVVFALLLLKYQMPRPISAAKTQNAIK
jgi:hypothetical protein